MSDNYVGWLRWIGDESHRSLSVCNSDSPGAFKAYREFEIVALCAQLQQEREAHAETRRDRGREWQESHGRITAYCNRLALLEPIAGAALELRPRLIGVGDFPDAVEGVFMPLLMALEALTAFAPATERKPAGPLERKEDEG
jgi:hypothetical protein